MKSGRKFYVEEHGSGYTDWGNIDPATKKLQKVTIKDNEIVDESNTRITKENGFKNICMLDPGTSPIAYLEALDQLGVERIEGDFVTYE